MLDQTVLQLLVFLKHYTVNDFGVWNLQAIRASTYENFTGPNTYSLARK